MKRIEDLINSKKDFEIPEALDGVVARAIKPNAKGVGYKKVFGGIAAIVIALNAFPAVATSVRDYDIAAPVIDFLTLSRFASVNNELALEIDVTVPDLSQLGEVGSQLNQKYQAEAEALYANYLDDYEGATPAEPIHKYVGSNYDFIQLTDRVLVVRNYLSVILGSGIEMRSYDIVDVEQQKVLEWGDLLTDEAKVVIAEYLDTYIQNHPKHFFAKDVSKANVLELSSDFFVNNKGQLVISFDEYSVAPGSFGVVTIPIPTEVISDFVNREDLIK
ncbi:MAG: hypothetical protein RL038_269 [Actinomycetota bacterium]